MSKAGLALVALGVATADSEAMWIPFLLVLAGAMLMRRGIE